MGTKKLLSLTVLAVAAVAVFWSFSKQQKDLKKDEVGVETSDRQMSLGVPKVMAPQSQADLNILLNDPSIRRNWGLMGTNGQSDILANKAWEISQGDEDIVVAVIDTGIDTQHPRLAGSIWQNPSKRIPAGRQASNNDDVFGWNFVGNNGDVRDNHGHGTHVAGIIKAVCPKVKIMVLKYFDPIAKTGDNLKNTIKAIQFAVKMGAKIINYSGGGLEPNEEEFSAIKQARDKGVLFIAAAGNEHSNSDLAHYYPANYNLDNIISVTAINSNGQVLKTSNYGENTVNIAAPGEDIYSTLPGGKYGKLTGTSQATAFVSGVAALVLAHNKDFTYTQVRNQIINSADEITGLRGKTAKSGKLNSYAALAMQPSIPASGIGRIQSSNQNMSVGVVANKSNSQAPSANGLGEIQAMLKAFDTPSARTSASSD